jgi:hypothetical protein
MTGLLAATQPARRIVVEGGGTPWWVPLAIALGVALVAALVSYVATWRFKAADFDRENALRTVDLVDEAELIASVEDRWRSEGGAETTMLRLQRARVRAQPLKDEALDNRFRAALMHNLDVRTWAPETSASRYWLSRAITSVREGLVPHLAAPMFFGRGEPREPSFPTSEELNAMPNSNEGSERIDALNEWDAQRRKAELEKASRGPRPARIRRMGGSG